MIKKLIIFIALSTFLFAQKNLYVNASIGSDATTYANNSSSTPWATITRAVYGSSNRGTPNASEAADAGDTVFVIAGTYVTTGTDSRWTPAYNSVNSGTAGNLIVYYAQGTVILQLSSITSPVFGASGVDYIEWNGFTVDEANALSHADTGPVVLHDTEYSRIVGCFIDGNGDAGQNDNHCGIRVEYGDNCYMSNNTIHDVYTSGVNGANGAGIMFYYSDDDTIENNLIYNCGALIFIKGYDNDRVVIRYNWMYNGTSVGIALGGCYNGLIYQNIVMNSYQSLRLWDYGTGTQPSGNTIYNNVFFNGTVGSFDLRVSTTLTNTSYNNIFYDSPYIYYSEQVNTPADLSSDYNSYYTYPTAFAGLTGGSQAVYLTITQWRSNFSLDANSITEDPTFVSTSGDSAEGFKLQVGSPAIGTGQGSINMGAYITGSETIGLGEASEPPEPPATSSVTTKINYKERP